MYRFIAETYVQLVATESMCYLLKPCDSETVDPYSAEVPGEMRSHTVLCGDLYMCLCRP